MEYVIRSGDGFLQNILTGEMVSAGQHDEGVFQAVRFERRVDAELAARRHRQRGFEAELVELETVPIEGD